MIGNRLDLGADQEIIPPESKAFPLSLSSFFPSSFISFPFLFFFRAPYEDKRENRLSPLYPSINPVHRIIEGPRLYRNVEKGEIGDEVEIFEGGKGVSQESKPSETFRGRKIKRECKRSFQDGVSLNFRERITLSFSSKLFNHSQYSSPRSICHQLSMILQIQKLENIEYFRFDRAFFQYLDFFPFFLSTTNIIIRDTWPVNKVRIIRLGFPKHSIAVARQPAGYTAVVGIRTLRFQRSLNKIRDRKSS